MTAPTLKVVSLDATAQHGTAIIAKDDSVWISIAPRWWDLASWLWWWLAPSDKKAWLNLATAGGQHVRTRAIRLARSYVRMGA